MLVTLSHRALTAYRLSTSEGEGNLPGRKTNSVCPQAWGCKGLARDRGQKHLCWTYHSYTDSQWGHRRMISLDHWVGRGIREWPPPWGTRFSPWVQDSSLGHRTPPWGTKVMSLLLPLLAQATAGMDAILIQLLDGHSIGINRKYVCPHHKALVGQNWGKGWQWVGLGPTVFFLCMPIISTLSH